MLFRSSSIQSIIEGIKNRIPEDFFSIDLMEESMCQAYINEKGIDVVSVRLGRIYGAPVRKTDTKSTTQFINNAVDNEDIILKSKGLQKFSYAYVADTVTAYLQLLANGQNGEAYNVAHDEIKTFVEVANILANINGKQVKFEHPDSTIQKDGYPHMAWFNAGR